MFTRSELEIKTLGELKGLCKQYGLKPLGNPAYKTAWIDALLTFAAIALRQMKEGEGLTRIPRITFYPLIQRDGALFKICRRGAIFSQSINAKTFF